MRRDSRGRPCLSPKLRSTRELGDVLLETEHEIYTTQFVESEENTKEKQLECCGLPLQGRIRPLATEEPALQLAGRPALLQRVQAGSRAWPSALSLAASATY
jgi:hypothetical protein